MNQHEKLKLVTACRTLFQGTECVVTSKVHHGLCTSIRLMHLILHHLHSVHNVKVAAVDYVTAWVNDRQYVSVGRIRNLTTDVHEIWYVRYT
jgi:hypothetical protein